MKTYKLSSKASVDISEIYIFGIHKFGIEVAKSHLSGLHHISNRLFERTELWRPAFYIKNGLFRYNYKSHVIFFTADDDFVFVLRVLHKNMDFESHL
jgi:toxin ParE1/3/4